MTRICVKHSALLFCGSNNHSLVEDHVMSEGKEIDKLNRQELYDRVWSTPGSKLSLEFGISDVAIAKRCKKMNVPRPTRGYWAKLEAGGHPRKTPLPPEAKLEIPVPEKLPISGRADQLHPIAAELLTRLHAANPDVDNWVKLKESAFPEVSISKALIKRTANALSVIIRGAEQRGIPYRKSRRRYGDTAYFEKTGDRLHVKIEEKVVTKTRERTEAEKRRQPTAAATRVQDQIPSGYLIFMIFSDSYSRECKKQWSEDEHSPLDAVVANVVQGICQYYVDMEKKRAEEKVRHEEWLKERKREEQEAERQEHQNNMDEVEMIRQEDLIKAAQWWKLNQVTEEFIQASEERWRKGQSGELTEAQQAWLSWARETSRATSPFEAGYPDPKIDGSFNRKAVPFGGPYPKRRNFPFPPTMPAVPPSENKSNSYYTAASSSESAQYPFWLKHQGR